VIRTAKFRRCGVATIPALEELSGVPASSKPGRLKFSPAVP